MSCHASSIRVVKPKNLFAAIINPLRISSRREASTIFITILLASSVSGSGHNITELMAVDSVRFSKVIDPKNEK